MIRDTAQMDETIEPKRRHRWWWLATLAVLLAIWWTWPAIQRWTAAEDSVQRSRLRFAVVTRGELVHDVAVQGRVVAASRSTLFSPSDGVVTLESREGERVNGGDVLATVDSPELRSQLQQERATLEALRSDYSRLELVARRQALQNRQRVDLLEVQTAAAERSLERSETLTREGLLNEIDLEQARDGLVMRRLELDQARNNLDLEREMVSFELRDARSRLERQGLLVRDVERRVAELEIRAPFDGLLAALEVEDRDAVLEGQAILGVVDLGELEVEVSIPESYADDLGPGVQAAIQIGDVPHHGTLVRIAPEVRGGQVEGRVAFGAGTPPGLRQNQRLATRLILDYRGDTLKVQRGPFFESLSGRQVYAVGADGVVRLLDVTLGAVSVNEVEILDGLTEGDEIVLSDLSRYQGAAALLLRD